MQGGESHKLSVGDKIRGLLLQKGRVWRTQSPFFAFLQRHPAQWVSINGKEDETEGMDQHGPEQREEGREGGRG
jgi:hypothetical protein